MRDCPLCRGSGRVSDRLGTYVTSPHDTYAKLKAAGYADQEQEHFLVLLLDSKNRITDTHVVAVGTLNRCGAHPRDVFRAAIRANAAGIIIAHNHPSNDPTPSDADIYLTRALIDAAEILDIKVFDHLVIAPDSFYSIRERQAEHGVKFYE